MRTYTSRTIRLTAWCIAAMLCTAAHAQTQPAGDDAGEAATSVRQVRRANSIQEALQFTDLDKDLIANVQDRISRLDETAFYVVLRHTAMMPQLAQGEWQAIDRPAYVNLLRRPGRYRAEPVKMNVQVAMVIRLAPGDGLGQSIQWPADRPVWRMSCLDADAIEPELAPIVVFSVFDPSEMLGKPLRTEGNTLIYPQTQAEIAGLFYKVYTDRDRDASLRDFPVMMASQMRRTAVAPLIGGGGGQSQVFLLLGIGALVFVFLYTRSKARRRQAEEPLPIIRRYPRPRDDEGEGDSAGPSRTGDEAGQIDPELRDAARQYRKEGRNEGAADDKS